MQGDSVQLNVTVRNRCTGIEDISWFGIGRSGYLDHFVVQLAIVTFCAIVAQGLAIGIFQLNAMESANVQGTILATIVANTSGVVIFRRFSRMPGARRFSFAAQSFLIPTSALVLGILALRLPYTNWLLLTGLGGGFIAAAMLDALRKPSTSTCFYFVPSKKTVSLSKELSGVPRKFLAAPADLAKCRDGVVVIDLREDLPQDWERAVAHAVVQGIPVYHVKQIQESLTGRVQIETISENSFGSLVPSLNYLMTKRVMDAIGSALALIVLLLPMLVIAAIIRLTSPGPALYRHTRIGYRGIKFETLKFRTMGISTSNDSDLETQKTRQDDPRVTSVGRFLRKSRLDELPQLINVLRGEMSLIGPRPEALALSRWYDEHLDFYEYRHIVRPGITGWAQVNQGHVTELDDVYIKLQYDFFYIKNLSSWLDLLIALRTVAVMFNFRGAV